MLPLIAVPVIHSSGAWIASTAASGYIAGTLSGTWVGAFVLGNAGWLSGAGVISAAGWIGASGAIASMAASTGAFAGTALTAMGLGGVAQSIGLVPVTLLGLTPVGWAISATTIGGLSTVGYISLRRALRRINTEREKAGVDPINVSQIFREIRAHERRSKLELLKRAAKGRSNWQISGDDERVSINDEEFFIERTRFVVEKDKTVKFVILSKLGKIIRTFRIDPRTFEMA